MNTLDKGKVNLITPDYYNNRELSWLAFNERVLGEAVDHRNPLFERLKFLAIFSSNLDEFFMVRVAGLLNQVEAGFNNPENKAGLTPKQQLQEIAMKTHELVERQTKTLKSLLLPQLMDENIEFLKMEDLSDNEVEHLEEYFEEQIFPLLTPMAVDAYRPFPMLLNKSLNLAIVLEDKKKNKEETKMAILQVPAVLDRFVSLNSHSGILDSSSQHTFYLLANTSINGLRHKDRLKLALIASFKSNGLLKQYVARYENWFSREELQEIRVAGAIAKMASALDVSKRGIVKSVSIKSGKDRNELILEVVCAGNLFAEKYQAEKQLRHLEKAMKKNIKIVFTN